MNSHELLAISKEIQTVLNPNKSLVRTLESCTEVWDTLVQRLVALNRTASDEETFAARAAILELVKQTAQVLQTVELRSLFASIEEALVLCERLDGIPEFAVSTVPADAVLGLHEFNSDYQRFIQTHGLAEAMQAIFTARDLIRSLGRIYHGAKLLSASLVPILPATSADEEVLSLYLLCQDSLEEFARKLIAVSRIYEEFSLLLGLSLATHPLKVVNAESGSLALTVIGSVGGIQLLKLAIKEGVKFLHRNYTIEGRIAEMPKRFELLTKASKITEQLEKRGVNVETSKEQIGKTNAILNREIGVLLTGVTRAEIDGQQEPIVSESLPELLSGRETPLLQNRLGGNY